MVDSSDETGSIWLTGSQQFHLMNNVTESLAGRVGIVHMLGLSNAEIDERQSQPFAPSLNKLGKMLEDRRPFTIVEAFERIYKGSLPAVYSTPIENLENYYSSYVDTYIKRDVSDMTQVADQTAFFRFMRVVAAHSGQVANISSMANDADIAPNTAKKWLSILVSTGLVIELEPFHSKVLTRVRKAPKLHFMDLGLCAHLMGWPNATTLERSSSSGALFESWMISEFYKGYINAGKTPHFFYYRDQRKLEVDLIIQEGTVLYPIEIKAAARTRISDTDAMRQFRKKINKHNGEGGDSLYEVAEGFVVNMNESAGFFTEDDWTIPAWIV